MAPDWQIYVSTSYCLVLVSKAATLLYRSLHVAYTCACLGVLSLDLRKPGGLNILSAAVLGDQILRGSFLAVLLTDIKHMAATKCRACDQDSTLRTKTTIIKGSFNPALSFHPAFLRGTRRGMLLLTIPQEERSIAPWSETPQSM